VTRIIFEDREAVGIAMIGRRDGITMHIKAKKEVILAAGPVFSANILHKSGVGPRAMLEESNVRVFVVSNDP
jgi:choline dehydrogenase